MGDQDSARENPPGSTATAERKPRMGRILGLVVLCTVAYLVVLFVFIRAGGERREVFTPGAAIGADRVEVYATMLSVDAYDNTYKLRLGVRPCGAYRGANGAPAQDLRMTVDEIGNDRTVDLPAGQWIPQREITLSASGDTADYPFDSHHIPLEIQLVDAQRQPVPVLVDLRAALNDWAVTATQQPESRTATSDWTWQQAVPLRWSPSRSG